MKSKKKHSRQALLKQMPVFANYVQLTTNPKMQECILLFAHLAPSLSDEDVTIGDTRARVTMTLSTVKQLGESIAASIARYEEEYGTVPLAPLRTEVDLN